ncbi:MAG: hypothetical protein IJA05_06820 [Oscillospiraceae bacterium]|nr:hypothetical protein [Oscillospiraceae bacterium]
MVTETQKRIEAYRELLPGLREKVTAVAFLLALSVIMLTSASYAWLTISRAPEVTAVSTNIAANGSLEIALATGDGKTAPGESQVGDSSAAEGQNIKDANITWGNLINLNDPTYGLQNLVLRPAQLNTTSLLESPLYGAEYKEDGRVEKLTSDFGYAMWVPPEGNKPGYFGIGDEYGVRAISSKKIEAVGAAVTYLELLGEAKSKNLAAQTAYTNIVAGGNNNPYMKSLANIMGKYMTDNMDNDGTYNNPEVNVADINNLISLYEEFLEVIDIEVEAIADLANVQLFLLHGEGGYTPYTKETIYEAKTSANLAKNDITISNLEGLLNDKTKIENGLVTLKGLSSSGEKIYWDTHNMNNVINSLVNVGECEMHDGVKIKNIGATAAMNYLGDGNSAIITNGVLYNFELRTGAYISVKDLVITVSAKRSIINMKDKEVKTNVYTSASKAGYNLFDNDLAVTEGMNDGSYKGGKEIVEDTYGLAVDLWVRTNSAGSYLTLEGNVLTSSEDVEATGKDANGNIVDIYTVTISETDEETGGTVSYSMDVYKSHETITNPDDGQQVEKEYWHSAETHTIITDEELGGKTPTRKIETVVTVIGYEGENRIWGENELISTDATTQGGGSCYVYYADSPEDMERSLKLLESFKVVFVGGNGQKLATAGMDTERYFAESGRVTVPLVLEANDSIDLGEDYTGNTVYGITALEQNEPTRITAIVYLDGTKLGNSEVLSASDIQGQLNIQFGSSQSLEPIENEDLAGKTLTVSASVDKITFDYDTETGPMTSTFTVNVDGYEPDAVKAYLIRRVSATQGSREAELTFDGSGNTWTCEYEFTTPGVYILRTVNLDGTDHDLAPDNLPTVTVKGFAIRSFNCDQATGNYVNIMTAENSATLDLNLQFSTEDPSKMPTAVQARFLSENGAVNADFVYNQTNQTWKAKATFHSSGEYTLQYIVLDGEIKELDSTMWQTASITLGMKVAVYSSSPKQFKYVPSEMADNEKLLDMEVTIMDNAGNEITGLSGAKLFYTMKGSTNKMDTDLIWNGRYYAGELATTGPGIWQFNRVEVKIGEKTNNLTVATESPTFTILSPEPPEYVRHNTVSYQYKPNNDATMNVLISNSSAATVQAYIVKNGAAEGTWVNGVIGQEDTTGGKPANYWNFKVPTDANGYQDGRWNLTTLRLWNVFAADGTAYTEETPLEIDVSNENNKTKVVSRVFVSFAEDKSYNFGREGGKTDGKVTGAFMDSYTVSGISVNIQDFENQKIDGISDVKLSFTYENNSQKYGGYTGVTNANADFNITLTNSDDYGINFVQSGSHTLQYAGSWTTTFSFKVGSQTMTYSGDSLPANAPVYTVSSVTPSVTVSSISPSGTIKTTISYSGTEPNGNYTYGNEVTNGAISGKPYEWNAYASAKDQGTGDAGFELPTITFAASGLNSVDILEFTIPAGSSNVLNVSITGNGNNTKTLGSLSVYKEKSGCVTYTVYQYNGHGTIKISEVAVKHNNETYTIYLENPITVYNPSSIPNSPISNS